MIEPCSDSQPHSATLLIPDQVPKYNHSCSYTKPSLSLSFPLFPNPQPSPGSAPPMVRPRTQAPRLPPTLPETLCISLLRHPQTVFVLSFSLEGRLLRSQNCSLALPAPPGFPPDRGYLCRRSCLGGCKAEGSRPGAEAPRSPRAATSSASFLDPCARFLPQARSQWRWQQQLGGWARICRALLRSSANRKRALPLRTPSQVRHLLLASVHSTFWNFCPYPLHAFPR